MILRDAIDFPGGPSEFLGFFDGMDNTRYLSWHPDHKLFRWTKGQGLRVGNEFYFEEVIAGKLLKKNVVLTRVEDSGHIEFAPTFWLMRLLLPRMIFRLEPSSSGIQRLVAEVHIRVGPLGARLNKREFDAVREHMRIEGINLKRFAESTREQLSRPADA